MGRGPMHLTKAIEILKEGAGEHFDPGVVNCFLECLDELTKQDKCNYFTRESHKLLKFTYHKIDKYFYKYRISS